MRRLFEIASILLLCLGSIALIGLQVKPFGWLPLLIGAFLLLFSRRNFAKDILLIYISVAILGSTSITTDTSYLHVLQMGTAVILAIAIPYFVSRYIYKDYLVRFKFHHGRNWYKTEVFYIALTVIVSYFLLPFYLKNSNAYLNWSVTPEMGNIIKFFIGINALGIWDELFFVSTVLGILRRYMRFYIANIVQAIIFTSFLYELGFTGWGPLMIYPFALLQGYVFKRTESLFYVITIHLSLDLILFLALINSHHPNWADIFFI